MRRCTAKQMNVRSWSSCAAISRARPCRTSVSNERLKRDRAGNVVLQLKSPYRDGTPHIVMSPLEFMQRLAALVPRPRLHLIRFHGVLAPHAKLRSAIVPQPVPEQATIACEHACDSSTKPCPPSGAAKISWARLLKRVFDQDLEHCPNCGSELKMIAAIEDPAVIGQILRSLNLSHPSATPIAGPFSTAV